jgi:TetR/AcrR family transcriptional repressor of nem operon
MGRPREFDEHAVLDAAMHRFWRHGFEATSIRDLIESTGLTGASLYNAFGDKQSLYRKALDHYVDGSIADRIRRCQALPPLDGIRAFLQEVVAKSLADQDCKGCMLVNAALDAAPEDPAFRKAVAGILARMEGFFLARVEAGQADGSISRALPAPQLAHHLLAVLMGIRVLARVRPEAALLEGSVAAALALLRHDPADPR